MALFENIKKMKHKDIELVSPFDETANMSEDMAMKIREHKNICDFIHNLYVTKNRDYGDSMHPLYEEYGLTAFMVLFGIKISRIKSLMTKGNPKYESIEDSLLDLANYAMIAVIELRAKRNSNVISGNSEKEILHKIMTSNPNIIYREEK